MISNAMVEALLVEIEQYKATLLVTLCDDGTYNVWPEYSNTGPAMAPFEDVTEAELKFVQLRYPNKVVIHHTPE